jgi:hypothetical protein
MPKENDLEGRQDMGGKHGGQAGVPEPQPIPDDASARDQAGPAQQKSSKRSQRRKAKALSRSRGLDAGFWPR